LEKAEQSYGAGYDSSNHSIIAYYNYRANGLASTLAANESIQER
jgi:hypothetical protein